VTTSTPRDRRAERRAATMREILDAAWALAAARGLTGWPLKDLADDVGMRAPSLYVYVDSKNALYDAMFADGYRQLLGHLERLPRHGTPLDVLHRGTMMCFDFCTDSPARFQLLFLRTLPSFEPTPASYSSASQVLEQLAGALADVGAAEPRTLDLFTAMLTGLASQQISNDPGGDRWRSLVDPAVDLILASAATGSRTQDGGDGGLVTEPLNGRRPPP
jgi:AcrR family transcriptional regulator